MAGNMEEFLRRAIAEKLGKKVTDVEILPGDQGPAAASQLPDTEQARESIENADEHLEEHIHQAFDHDVGSLSHEDEPTDGASSGSGQQVPLKLRDMFRSKSALRNAIIMREIFDRPESRW